jgi:hypothetical protein
MQGGCDQSFWFVLPPSICNFPWGPNEPHDYLVAESFRLCNEHRSDSVVDFNKGIKIGLITVMGQLENTQALVQE